MIVPSDAQPVSSPSPAAPFDGHGLKIGIFDSGLGGLSVLRALRAALPASDMVYAADSGHAPYGERDDVFIAERSTHITDFLLDLGADVVVVACNTATAAAVHHLRGQWPQVPVIGVEPAVKPAVACSRNGRVGVLATPLTLGSRKFQDLVARHGGDAQILLQPCPGLAGEIERGRLDSPGLRDLVNRFARPLKEAGVDTAVLGCTHYPFVQPLFAEALGPDVVILDTAEAVARQTKKIGQQLLADSMVAHRHETDGRVELWTTGDAAHLSDVAGRWLGLNAPVRPMPGGTPPRPGP